MTDVDVTVDSPAPTKSRLRWLRIVISNIFGLLTVTLVVLWVRSYGNCNAIYGPLFDTHKFNLSMSWGQVRFASFDCTYESQFTGRRLNGWGTTSSQIDSPPSLTLVKTPLTSFGLGFAGSRDHYGIVAVVPIYALVASASALTCAPWLITFRNRFSLRSLLIAITLLGFFMGIALWVVR